ncbi:MAG: methylenetetrahydrofolate reductase [Gammaproteobacteria bacterium]|nr:methylenetetrahydrofolate reductase [Gammaproteobacteria bacterium]
MKTFDDALRTKDFAISAEVYLRPEVDAASLCGQAEILKDYVDAILLTDNQFGQLHMSTIAAASILLAEGIDPIVQLTCRNRNRIALISDLLGAAAIGVTSILLMAGERAPPEFKPKPKPVLDLTATELIRTASMLNSDERLSNPSNFLVGGIVTPIIPKASWKATKLTEKIEAGAQFVQTHICMDTRVLTAYMKHLVDKQFIRRTSVIGAVAVIESAEDAEWLRDNRPSVNIPDELVGRLRSAADPRAEGITICAETLRAIAGIPGMAGANIIATRDLKTIPEAIREAGIT